ncbi:unnamed protein product, partial [Oppiella nova]
NAIWKGTKYTADAEDEKVVTELSGKGGDIKYQSIKDLSESSSQSQQKSTPNAPQNNRLLKVIGKGFWFYFLIPSILKLVADVVQLANPMIMKLLISFTTDADEPSWHGYMYAILLIFTNIFQSLINGYQAQRMSVLGMRIRTCLVSAVYRKSLVLSNHSKKDTTSGEIVNLMAVDSQRFVDMLPYLSFLWTAPVQIAISLYLLYNEMGLATLGGLVVMLLLIPVNGWVSTKIRTIQSKQMKLKDQRLYGWEEAFVKNVLDIRKRELRLIWKSGLISGVTVVLAGTTPLLVALITFGLYIGLDSDNKLDAQKAFVSIALFNLLRIPLTIVPNMVTSLIMTLVSVKRLNKFLNFSELSGYVTRHTDQKEVVKIENGSFTWDSVEEVQSGMKPTLEKINMRVMKGKFVAVVGNVGSGKSSLLSALLGDMEICGGMVGNVGSGKSSLLSALLGDMEICGGSVNINGDAQVAYVPQQAWIQNATLKDNILFGQPFDSRKYRKVIKACALKSDLLTLAGGDETEIGEKGINLSGGQKQRVSLARAVYSEADLYLFDDPLSAVDSHVGKQLLDEVLSSRTGLLHNKTRILVTNSLFVLPDVDYIIVLKNGKITDFGTYDELMALKGDFAELITQYTTNEVTDNDSDSNHSSEVAVRHRASTTEIPANNEETNDKSKLVETETMGTGSVKFEVYKKYAMAMSMFWTISMLIGFCGQNGFNSGSSFWLTNWTEDPDGTAKTGYYLGIYAVIGLLQTVFVWYSWYSIVLGSLRASRNLVVFDDSLY